MATNVLASIGDHGFLNEQLPAALAGVWIDRDLNLANQIITHAKYLKQ